MTENKYHPTKLKPLVRLIARAIKDNPALLDDIDDPHFPLAYLHAQLAARIPKFNDKKYCLNCGASMLQYSMQLNVFGATLLLKMGEIVRDRIEDTRSNMDFTEANRIRVSSESGLTHAEKCQVTKASKLGLIAKAGNAEWSITRRGWDALKGKPFPRSRITFHGQIIDRPEDTTTLAAIFTEYREQKKKKPEVEMQYEGYNAEDWYNIGGYQEGEVI
jgi:hypothetical protein